MTVQPTMFGYAIARTRQPELYDGCAVPTGRHCSECGRELVETASGYHCCPIGHGKLLTPAAGVDAAAEDDESLPAWTWPQHARRIATEHATRDTWLGTDWRCGCGACSRARLDGFIPGEDLSGDR